MKNREYWFSSASAVLYLLYTRTRKMRTAERVYDGMNRTEQNSTSSNIPPLKNLTQTDNYLSWRWKSIDRNFHGNWTVRTLLVHIMLFGLRVVMCPLIWWLRLCGCFFLLFWTRMFVCGCFRGSYLWIFRNDIIFFSGGITGSLFFFGVTCSVAHFFELRI